MTKVDNILQSIYCEIPQKCQKFIKKALQIVFAMLFLFKITIY